MTTSFKEIEEKVLRRLSAVFDPPHPKVLNGQPNPRYTAAVQVYLEALQPFNLWELEAGVKLALETHRYRKWPLPAELRNWSVQAQRDGKPPPVKTALPAKVEPAPISTEDSERIGFQLEVLGEYQRAGQWKSLAECKAEALRRMENRKTSRLSQAS